MRLKKFITKCDRGLLQSASGITKYGRRLLQSASGIAKFDRNLLQSVSSTTKCDSLLLQSASGITKCDIYYKVRRKTSPSFSIIPVTFTSSKLIIETLQKGVKYVQS